MSYQVVLLKAAERDLSRLDKAVLPNVAKHLKALEADPRPANVTKLRGTENEWRIRVGDYRIIYEINDDKRVVAILRIRHRREAYR
ncbi:MAG: type II toxin-antitoxin system RelE/ParE family toxin [Anaerolineae bacterium]